MITIGIVAAKSRSERFPGKNAFIHEGVPLFWHSVQALLDSRFVNDVFVATDSEEISEFCQEKGVGVIVRGENARDTDEPLIDVLKYCVKSLDLSFDAVATIMANCPNHRGSDVDAAVRALENNADLNEVRGFDQIGTETGLMVFRKNLIRSSFQISSHIGSITCDGYEVHYREDLR